MHSERHFVNFEGLQPFVLHVYFYPRESGADRLVKKFDAFLCGAQEKNYETDFIEFKAAHEKRHIAESRLKEKMSSLASCDAVIAARNRIRSEMAIPVDLKTKVEEAAARRLQLIGEAEVLRHDILKQTELEKLAIHSVQTQMEIALSRRTITQFE